MLKGGEGEGKKRKINKTGSDKGKVFSIKNTVLKKAQYDSKYWSRMYHAVGSALVVFKELLYFADGQDGM